MAKSKTTKTSKDISFKEYYSPIKLDDTNDASLIGSALDNYAVNISTHVFLLLFKEVYGKISFDYTSSKISDKWILNMVKNLDCKIMSIELDYGLQNKKSVGQVILIDEKNKIIVAVQSDSNVHLSYSLTTSEDVLEQYVKQVRNIQKKPIKKIIKKGRIFMLSVVGVGKKAHVGFKSFKFRPINVSVRNNYNKDFEAVHKHILSKLNEKDGKGVVILHGEAGTGKTFYMRHLCKVLKKKVLYIPPALVGSITDPSFMSLLGRHKNSVLVIEDADNIVRKRDDFSDMQTVSTILNLSDGMLNDVLNLQIVLSFNTDIRNIDPAILREGRLIAEYKFDKLEVVKAQELSDSLGFELKVKEPMTLSSVYNQGETRITSTSDALSLGFKS